MFVWESCNRTLPCSEEHVIVPFNGRCVGPQLDVANALKPANLKNTVGTVGNSVASLMICNTFRED